MRTRLILLSLGLLLSACYVSQEEICDLDGDGFIAVECGGDDCDDSDPTVYPGATEYCDGKDNNCDGVVDGPDAVDADEWWVDADGDGWGDASQSVLACDAPEGYAGQAGDCDDTDPEVNPGALEICDGIDNNCSGLVDDDDPEVTDQRTWYLDFDGDTWGDDETTVFQCFAPDGWVERGEDCDDTNPNVYPGAPEVCDGVDNNCNGLVDWDDPLMEGYASWYRDADGDGFGDPDVWAEACEAPEGFLADNTDCDDTRADVYPGATEVCDGVDNSCNGLIDDEDPDVVGQVTWFRDYDGDTWGDDGFTVEACFQPTGFVDVGGDCDDTNPNVYPGAPEVCDGLDNNCNGLVDDDDPDVVGQVTWFRDYDGDGFGDDDFTVDACYAPDGFVDVGGDCDDDDPDTYPGAPELCDGKDNNCDGFVDGLVLGQGPVCAGFTCRDIWETRVAAGADPTSLVNGTYWIDPEGGSPFQVECNMEQGGYTRLTSTLLYERGWVDFSVSDPPGHECPDWSYITDWEYLDDQWEVWLIPIGYACSPFSNYQCDLRSLRAAAELPFSFTSWRGGWTARKESHFHDMIAGPWGDSRFEEPFMDGTCPGGVRFGTPDVLLKMGAEWGSAYTWSAQNFQWGGFPSTWSPAPVVATDEIRWEVMGDGEGYVRGIRLQDIEIWVH